MSRESSRSICVAGWGILLPLAALSGCGGAPALGGVETGPASPMATGAEAEYTVYVGAESADLIHRITFGPDGAVLEQTTEVGEMALETEGPHGLRTSPDGEFLYMTTGHGVPDGKIWKFEAGPDTLVAEPILLGYFPATLDLTPDGLYAFVVNFNLHGEMVPSSVSVVFTPDMVEVTQITTCTMPHGARFEPQGVFLYSNCMMDDQVVEIDSRTFEVTRRFSVAQGSEGPIAVGTGGGMMHDMPGMMHEPTCSPTWAQPHPDGRRLYVACNRGDWILELDRVEWTVLRTLRTSDRGPYNLDVTPDGRLLVATLKQSGKVEFLDIESGRSMGVLPTSTNVTHGVVVSPDSRYAFVSAEGVGAEPGKVDIYDLRSFERVADVPVGQQAGGITFWRMRPAG